MLDTRDDMLFIALALSLLCLGSEGAAFSPRSTTSIDHFAPTSQGPAPTLFARAGYTLFGESRTCGYFEGLESDPYACSASLYCAYVQAEENWGPFCCPYGSSDEDGCPFNYATTCLDYAFNTHLESYELTTSGTLFCGQDNPVCMTGYLEGDERNSKSPTYTQYECATTFTERTAYQTVSYTYDLDDEDLDFFDPITTIITKDGTTQTVVTTTSVTTNPGPDISHITEPGSASEPTLPPEPETEPVSSKSNTAAIGGGIGGGLAGLLLIIGGIVAFLKHKKKKERERGVPEIEN